MLTIWLVAGLAAAKDCTHVEFAIPDDCTKLTSTGAMSLAEVTTLAASLQTNTGLIELDVTEGGFGAVGATLLVEAINNNAASSLKYLLLHHNDIGPGAEPAIVAMLSTNTVLTLLDLGDNKLGDAGAIALANALTNNPTTALTEMYMNSNDIGPGAEAAIWTMLSTNTVLKFMYLHSNKLTGAGLESLASADTLEYLYLNNNKFTTAAAKALADKLHVFKMLLVLKLDSNKIEAEGVTALENAFAKLTLPAGASLSLKDQTPPPAAPAPPAPKAPTSSSGSPTKKSRTTIIVVLVLGGLLGLGGLWFWWARTRTAKVITTKYAGF